MTPKTDDVMLVLNKTAHGNRLKVALDSFLLFNNEMDHELDQLVDRWSDFMTPMSVRETRRR